MPRGRFLICIVCVLACAVILAAQQPTPPTFRAGAVLVTVDAYPQQNGQIVEGLKPEDFELFEDKRRQQITNFSYISTRAAGEAAPWIRTPSARPGLAADPKNRLFVVYLDTYHVDVSGSRGAEAVGRHAQQGADTKRLVWRDDAQMRPSDLTLARKLQSIEDQLTRYWPWGARFSIARPRMKSSSTSASGTKVKDGAVVRDLADVVAMRRHEDQTLSSLEDLVRYLATLREARTAVLLFTDGWLLYEPDSTLGNLRAAGHAELRGRTPARRQCR
jgi:hypothetical protein